MLIFWYNNSNSNIMLSINYLTLINNRKNNNIVLEYSNIVICNLNMYTQAQYLCECITNATSIESV